MLLIGAELLQRDHRKRQVRSVRFEAHKLSLLVQIAGSQPTVLAIVVRSRVRPKPLTYTSRYGALGPTGATCGQIRETCATKPILRLFRGVLQPAKTLYSS